MTILCYHRVLPYEQKLRYFLPELVVTPTSFRQHCVTLRRHYDVLPLGQALQALQAAHDRTKPLAVVTFDDGYQDNFRYAAPVLAETDVKATFFVIADLIGTPILPWYDRVGAAVSELQRQGRAREVLAQFGNTDGAARSLGTMKNEAALPREIVANVKQLDPTRRKAFVDYVCGAIPSDFSPVADDLIMDWGQLAALAESGHEIGSHSSTHEILTQLDDATLENEVAGSRASLETGLGVPVRAFCYPNGDVDARVARAVVSAGYSCAVTVRQGTDGPDANAYHLRRWFIHEDRLAGLSGRSSAARLRMQLCDLTRRLSWSGQTRVETV
ncbi:MAG: polysaccharide deacetylase family protein [Phycisphaerae bacterium]